MLEGLRDVALELGIILGPVTETVPARKPRPAQCCSPEARLRCGPSRGRPRRPGAVRRPGC
ncbi:hypothetical protein I552_4587 [Mycobacterium xenopi 3993]|nr:hypothetical protein I552_4587 [Mycobacterium xenopi 3993]